MFRTIETFCFRGQGRPGWLGLIITITLSAAATLAPEAARGQGDALVVLCYRDRNIQVPIYLVSRYVAAGATIGFCPGMGEAVVDNRMVSTSIAFGVFTPPTGYGVAERFAFARTLMSQEAENDASGILDLPGNDGLLERISADPVFPDMLEAPLASAYASLDNFEFLTGSLASLGDARLQMEAAFQQRFDQLAADNPGVTFLAPSLAGSVNFLGTTAYSLFGGTFPDLPIAGDTTTVIGTVNVDFYAGDFTVEVVPEPSNLCLSLLGVTLIAYTCGICRRPEFFRRLVPDEVAPQ